jgi:hypothetical protein
MVLPLIALGFGGLWGATKIRDQRAEEKERAADDRFSALATRQQEGLDLNSPEGISEYGKRMAAARPTAQGGLNMLTQAAAQRQQQGQFQQEFNNLSAYRDAQLKQRQAEMQAAQQQQVEAQKMFTPQQIGQRQIDLYKQFNADTNDFRDQAGYYDQLEALLSKENGTAADTTAAITNFVKITDPGSIVSGKEGESIRENATGAAGQLRDMLGKLEGKGFTRETRAAIGGAALSMINASAKNARARAQGIRGLAAGNPAMGIPAIDMNFIDQGFLRDRELPESLRTAIIAGSKGGSTGKVQRNQNLSDPAFISKLVPESEYKKRR